MNELYDDNGFGILSGDEYGLMAEHIPVGGLDEFVAGFCEDHRPKVGSRILIYKEGVWIEPKPGEAVWWGGSPIDLLSAIVTQNKGDGFSLSSRPDTVFPNLSPGKAKLAIDELSQALMCCSCYINEPPGLPSNRLTAEKPLDRS